MVDSTNSQKYLGGEQNMSGERQEIKDRSIGAIISETRQLSVEQVERILEHQRSHNTRFGESAVALGYVSYDDVLFALSQQFHYPYASEEQRKEAPELVSLNQPFGAQAEAVRAVRSQLTMRVWNDDSPRRALAVISGEQGDGKTYFSSNLAVTLAQLGGRSLLIDANMRDSRLHEVFGLSNNSGLSGILSGRSESNVIQQANGVPNLFVMTGGTTPPNPLELVERPVFGLLMRELCSKFDYVVVDTPAASMGADASVVAARCGAALFVARKNQTTAASLSELVGIVSIAPVLIAGVVMNEH